MFASKSARNRCSDLRFVSCWPMFDSTRGPVGVVKRRCVRLDSLCGSHVALREVSGAIDGSSLRAWRDRWVVANVAVRGLCLAPCVARWLFLIAQTSLCAVFAAISARNSSEPRCGRSFRPIVFSTLVSYRAGRCLRTWVSSNAAVRGVC